MQSVQSVHGGNNKLFTRPAPFNAATRPSTTLSFSATVPDPLLSGDHLRVRHSGVILTADSDGSGTIDGDAARNGHETPVTGVQVNEFSRLTHTPPGTDDSAEEPRVVLHHGSPTQSVPIRHGVAETSDAMPVEHSQNGFSLQTGYPEVSTGHGGGHDAQPTTDLPMANGHAMPTGDYTARSVITMSPKVKSKTPPKAIDPAYQPFLISNHRYHALPPAEKQALVQQFVHMTNPAQYDEKPPDHGMGGDAAFSIYQRLPNLMRQDLHRQVTDKLGLTEVKRGRVMDTPLMFDANYKPEQTQAKDSLDTLYYRRLFQLHARYTNGELYHYPAADDAEHINYYPLHPEDVRIAKQRALEAKSAPAAASHSGHDTPDDEMLPDDEDGMQAWLTQTGPGHNVSASTPTRSGSVLTLPGRPMSPRRKGLLAGAVAAGLGIVSTIGGAVGSLLSGGSVPSAAKPDPAAVAIHAPHIASAQPKPVLTPPEVTAPEPVTLTPEPEEDMSLGFKLPNLRNVTPNVDEIQRRLRMPFAVDDSLPQQIILNPTIPPIEKVIPKTTSPGHIYIRGQASGKVVLEGSGHVMVFNYVMPYTDGKLPTFQASMPDGGSAYFLNTHNEANFRLDAGPIDANGKPLPDSHDVVIINEMPINSEIRTSATMVIARNHELVREDNPDSQTNRWYPKRLKVKNPANAGEAATRILVKNYTETDLENPVKALEITSKLFPRIDEYNAYQNKTAREKGKK